MTEKKQKYWIGEIVSGPAQVQGVVHATMYKSKMVSPNQTFYEWDINYPNWENEVVYFLYYMKPRKIVSRKEFIEQNPSIKEEYIDWEYDKVPERTVMIVPQSGLLEATEEELEEWAEMIENYTSGSCECSNPDCDEEDLEE